MRYIVNFFKSKFLIAVAAFGVWLFFFDKNDVPSQIARKQEERALNAKIKYYKEQIRETSDELNNLQSDPAALEKYAREKYFMKRDNEEVFIIE
ncbi:MAG: septum formation initiator family protein [Bacteroidota bacterium]